MEKKTSTVKKRVTKKARPKLTIGDIETKPFNEIDWAMYEQDVIDLKDQLDELYGKRFYKKIMKKIHKKPSRFKKMLDIIFMKED